MNEYTPLTPAEQAQMEADYQRWINTPMDITTAFNYHSEVKFAFHSTATTWADVHITR